MPLQNRVLPNGDIVASPARGTFTGNRGIIHRDDRTLGTSRWSHHAWICCTLDWQGRKRQVMTGRNWTELFFLDEAVALAAGHRPCGYCRRADYNAFTTCWREARGQCDKAPNMDKVLHASRVHGRTRAKVTYTDMADRLPNGTFIALDHVPHLIWDGKVRPYTPTGYKAAVSVPVDQPVTVLTPKPMVQVLQAGYSPALHPSATIDVSDRNP